MHDEPSKLPSGETLDTRRTRDEIQDDIHCWDTKVRSPEGQTVEVYRTQTIVPFYPAPNYWIVTGTDGLKDFLPVFYSEKELRARLHENYDVYAYETLVEAAVRMYREDPRRLPERANFMPYDL